MVGNGMYSELSNDLLAMQEVKYNIKEQQKIQNDQKEQMAENACTLPCFLHDKIRMGNGLYTSLVSNTNGNMEMGIKIQLPYQSHLVHQVNIISYEVHKYDLEINNFAGKTLDSLSSNSK